MAKQKFGLGRGLDALISGASEVMAAQQPSRVNEQNILLVPIDSVMPNPRQPRKVFREDDPRLLELSASIKEHGLLQPLVVTRLDGNATSNTAPGNAAEQADSWFGAAPVDNRAPAQKDKAGVVQYQIIAGERRWRAARLAGLTKIPVVVKEVTPLEMLELALIENIQRADLNPIEEALAYSALIAEFGLTQEMVARQVGKDRSTITNALRLLQLAPKVREALVNQLENFTEGHARALIGITREEDQVAAMQKIIALKLNVRQAEELAARIKAVERDDAAREDIVVRTSRRAPDIEALEAEFRNALMVKVDLKRNTKGRGTLVLHFNNEEELERLYSQLVKHED
ncbi:MAG TPA: ParB/RepB/Spo0J family partition protein [Ktedonobacteraceae bacterium]|nr:ParB/RepB/Spo0J family partition protein [Ktedonobacteraceae bacterium]